MTYDEVLLNRLSTEEKAKVLITKFKFIEGRNNDGFGLNFDLVKKQTDIKELNLNLYISLTYYSSPFTFVAVLDHLLENKFITSSEFDSLVQLHQKTEDIVDHSVKEILIWGESLGLDMSSEKIKFSYLLEKNV